MLLPVARELSPKLNFVAIATRLLMVGEGIAVPVSQQYNVSGARIIYIQQ